MDIPRDRNEDYPEEYLRMMLPRTPALATYLDIVAMPLLRGADVSGYRDFQLGMTLPAVLKQTGAASARPVGEEITLPSSYSTKAEVLARWEDPLNSVNLVSFPDLRSFGMVVFSKRADALARASILQSLRLEEQEAPQKELEGQKRQADKDRAEQEKLRIANKPRFRPRPV